MEQVRFDYNVKRSTVTFADGSEETIEYVDLYDRGDIIKLVDVSKESFKGSWSRYDEEPSIKYLPIDEETRIISSHNLQDIEHDWVDELTAIAEVEVEEVVTNSNLIFPDNTRHEVMIEDIKIWERIEWEAKQEREDN